MSGGVRKIKVLLDKVRGDRGRRMSKVVKECNEENLHLLKVSPPIFEESFWLPGWFPPDTLLVSGSTETMKMLT